MQVLIAGVGYTCLRDLSFGPVLVQRLKPLKWPKGVEVEDLSYHPIAVVQKLTGERIYDKIIFVGAVKRGREPGSIHRYRPDGSLPDEGEIQARIGEAVTGVISLESLLIICRFFEALPEEVVVIEVEPEDESWGDGFTPRVQDAVDKVIEMVETCLLDEEVGNMAEELTHSLPIAQAQATCACGCDCCVAPQDVAEGAAAHQLPIQAGTCTCGCDCCSPKVHQIETR